MNDFFGNIRSYTRNPLGIIALFIVLLYGIASLLFGVTSNYFNNEQVWTLLLFLIIYPIIVFFGFYRLVTKHHSKLYAPNDFKNDESFLKTLPHNQQLKKLDKEVNSVIEESKVKSKHFVAKDNAKASESTEIKSNIILSEDLVFRELESEYGAIIRRHVGESVDYGFDGYFSYKNMEIIVEIKYTEKGNWNLIVDQLRPQIRYLEQKTFSLRPYFLVVIVTNNLTNEEVKKGKDFIVNNLKLSHIMVKAKGYRLEELKTKYGINY